MMSVSQPDNFPGNRLFLLQIYQAKTLKFATEKPDFTYDRTGR